MAAGVPWRWKTSETGLTDIYGVGRVVAGLLIGFTGAYASGIFEVLGLVGRA